MSDRDDLLSVLRGKKLALQESIAAYERQLSALKLSDENYRRHSAILDRQLARYISDKESIDSEKAAILLQSEFNLPSKFLSTVSGATGIGRRQPELSKTNLRADEELQRRISGYDVRTQNICIAIARTNEEIAVLNRKFGEVNLSMVAGSRTLSGLKLQLIKTSQELATLELSDHRITLSGLGAARVVALARNSDDFMVNIRRDRVSCAVRRFVSGR